MKQQLRSLWRTAYATIVGVTLVATMAFAQTKPVTSPSAQNDGSTSQAELRKKADAIAARQGLEFEQNKGQVIDEKGKVRNDILFTSRSKGTSVYYFADKLSYVFQKELTKRPTAKDVASDEAYQPKYQVHRLDMNLVGANTSAKVASNDLQPGVKNYYLAHAGKDGITGVPSFGKLTYENVYPNIDMVLTAKGQGMKAEFIVRPGGDPSQIKMRFDGADKVALANDGGYSVTTPLGTMTEEKPYSFTSVNGKEQEVAVTFNVNGDVLSFNVPDYDKTQTLVIDPQRDWGTFHGGAGTDIILGVATERSYAPASGARYIYTCGYFGGTGFPLTAGTATASGSADAFVAAYTYGVSGARNYVTVFGGNSEDRANAITVGSSGIAYVVGRTSASLGTPLAANTLQTTYGGGAFDSYIASLSATGTLTAVTFFGTAGTNDNLTSIDLNSAGTEIVVGGNTSSATSQAPWATGLASNAGGEYMNTTQFPTGVQVTGLVATFAVSGTTISSRTRGTYYGATAGTQTIVTSVRYNRTTSGTAGVWVGGYTNSLDSIATPTSHNTGLNVDGSNVAQNGANLDGFVAFMNTNLGRTAGTYTGGINEDRILGIANDYNASNRVVAVGYTNSESNGTAHIAGGTASGGTNLVNGTGTTAQYDGFMVIYDLSGTALNRHFGTYWGSSNNDYLYAVDTDSNFVSEVAPNTVALGRGRKIFVAGHSNTATSTNLYNHGAAFTVATNNAAQGGFDSYVTRMSYTGTALSTEFAVVAGTAGDENTNAMVVDNQRNIILGGSTTGAAAGTIATTIQTTPGAAPDGYVAKFCDLIVPNTPDMSNDNGANWRTNASTSAQRTTCVDLRQTSYGTGATGVIGNGSTGVLVGDARQTFSIRFSNAVQGVTYRVFMADNGYAIPASADPLASGAADARQLLGTLTADGDGTMVFAFTATQLATAATALNGGVPIAALTDFDVFISASTPTGCFENGTAFDALLAPKPGDNRITQIQPAAYGDAANEAPRAVTRNFYVPYGATSELALTNVVGNSYLWTMHRVPGSTRAQLNTTNASTPTNNVTFSGSTTNAIQFTPSFNASFNPGNNTSHRDTIVFLVTETVTATGCSHQYTAVVYLVPVVNVAFGVADETPTTGSTGTNPTANNPTAVCHTSTAIPYRESSDLADPYNSAGTVNLSTAVPAITTNTNVLLTSSVTVHNATTATTSNVAFTGGANNTTNPGALTSAYQWAVASVWTTAGGVTPDATLAAGNFNISNPTSGSTMNVSSITAQPTSNPAFANFTLQETATGSGLGAGGAVRTVNYQTRVFPTPTATVSGSTDGTSVCEGSANTVYTITVTPNTITSGTFSVTLNASTQTGANIVSVGGAGITHTGTTGIGTTTVTGSWSGGNVFTITAARGTVTAVYDNLGTVTLSLTSLTNGAATTAGINCGLVSTVNSGTTTVTQIPDAIASGTRSGATTTTPAAATPTATIGVAPANGTGTALGTSFTNSATSQACQYVTADNYGVEHTYTVVPNNGTVPAVVADGLAWSCTGCSFPGATNAAAVTVRWTGTGAQTLTLVQTNNQAPGTCAFTNTYNVNVNAGPAAANVRWAGTAATTDDNFCEQQNVTFAIFNPNTNPIDVQIYGESNTPGPGAPAWTTGFTAVQQVTIAGGTTGATTTLTGSNGNNITGGTAPTYVDVTYRIVVRDNTTGCASYASSGSYATFTTPSLRIWDRPVTPVVVASTVPTGSVAGGATPCPSKLASPNQIIVPPTPDPGAYGYVVNNLASYPTGTTFTWSIVGLTTPNDYTIVNSDDVGYTNSRATIRWGTNTVGPQTIQLAIQFPAANGSCTLPATNAMSVVVQAIPIPDIAGQNANGTASMTVVPPITNGLCAGQTAQYNATGPGSSGAPTSWTWSVTAGGVTGTTIVGSNTNPTVTIQYGSITTPPNSQVHITPMPQISVVVSNGTCSASDTQSVYIKPIPSTAITFIPNATNDSACAFNSENTHIRTYAVPRSTNGTTISVAWTLSGSANGAIYSFTSSAGNTNDTVRVQWANGGTGTVTAVVTSSNGCTNTGSFTHQVFVPPAPVIFGPQSVCQNASGTYNVLPNVAGDTYSWEITPVHAGNVINGGVVSGIGLTTVPIVWGGNPNTTYTLRCIQRSAVGCTTRVTRTVTINPNPTPAIAPTSAVTACVGQPFTFSTADNTPTNSYAWTVTSGAATPTSGTQPTFTITPSAPGTINISLTETAIATTCATTVTKTNITAVAAPTGTINRTTAPTAAVGVACVGQNIAYSVTTTATVYQWAINGTNIAGATNSTYSNTWNAVGSNTLSVILTNGQCSTTVNQTVVVSAPPAPNVTGTAVACADGATPLLQYTYTTPFNAGNTYAWTAVGGPPGYIAVSPTNQNNITVQFFGTPPGGTVNMQVTETNTSGCTGTSTLPVTVIQRPLPTVPTAAAICQNSTGNYTFTGLITGSTRVFNVTGGTFTTTNAANSSTVNVTWTTAGTGIITLTETNGVCSYTTPNLNVTVNPAPTAFNVVPTNQSVCSGVAYTVGLNGSQTGVNYQLVENGSNVGTAVAGTGSAFSFPSITKTSATTVVFNYTVAATVTGTGCTANMTGSDVVTVNPLPTPSITQTPNPVCAGSNVTFSTAANAGRTYVWTAPAGYTVVGGAGTAAVTYSTTATTTSGTITVAETITATGCSATATFTSVISASPVVYNVTPATAQVCRPNTGTTTFNVQLSNSQTGTSYQVMNGIAPIGSAVAGTNAALTLPVTIGTGGNITNTGAYTLTVTATGTGACTTPVTMNGSVALTVNPTPTPSVAGNASVCVGSSQTYNTTNNAGSNYSWSLPVGWTVTAGLNTASITATVGTTTGAQTITVTETVAATTCSATSAAFTVTVNALPTPTITGPTSVCQGTSQTYSTGTFSTYAWTVPTGGTIASGQGTNTIQVNWTAAGSQTVNLSVTNANNCTGVTTANVTVNAQPIAYTVGTTTASLCATTPLPNAIITLSNAQAGVTYQLWRGTTGLTSQTPATAGPIQFTDNTYGGVGTFSYTIIGTLGTCVTTMTGTAVVTVNALPTPSISQTPSPFCAGNQVTFTTATGGTRTWNWTVPASGYTIASGQGTNTIIVNTTAAAVAGTVTVTETNTSTGCNATANFTSVVTAPPAVFNLTPANTAVCIGANITANLSSSATGVSYQAFVGTNAFGSAQTGTGAALTFTFPTGTGGGQLGVGTYAITVRGTATSGACTGTQIVMNGTVNATVNPNPTPSITGPTAVCTGQTYNYSTPASGNAYSWSAVNGTIVGPTNVNGITVTWGNTPGAGSVTVVETITATGCNTTTTSNVTITATPNVVITGPTTVCQNTTQTYTTAATGTYVWGLSNANGTITGGQGTNTINVNWTAQGTTTVSLAVTNAGCTGNGSSIVTIVAQPTLFNVATTTANACTNVANNVVITLSGSQTGVTYTLLRNGTADGATQTGTGSPLTFTRTNNTAGVYNYTITAALGACTSTMNGTATVTITAPPTPVVTGSLAVCEGSTAVYTVAPVNAGSAYAWTITGQASFTTNANQATVVWGTVAPVGTVQVAETDVNGCVGTSAAINVTLHDLPIAQTVGISPATICATGGFSGTNSSSVNIGSSEIGYTYNLMQGATVISTVTGNGNPRTFPALTGLTAGSYTYTVQAITNTVPACTTSMANAVTLTVVANPTPAVTGPTNPCQNATVTYVTTNNTGNTYAWTIQSGTATFVGPTNTYQAQAQWTAIGAGSIRVVETNSAGCAQQNTLSVNVIAAPTPSITGPATVCGTSTQTYSVTAVSGATYTWTVGANGNISSGIGTNSITVDWANTPNPAAAFNTTVAVTVNAGGCVGSNTLAVTINPQAIPVLTGDATRCSGQTGNYSTPFVVAGRTYSWNITNLPPGMTFTPIVNAANQNTLAVNWVNTGTTPVVATVSVTENPTPGTCSATSTFNVTVNPLPVVAISGPAAVCQNSTVNYSAAPPQTGLSYAWGVTNATSWTGQGTGTISVTWGAVNGVVTLNVTNTTTGCSAAASNNNYAVAVTLNPQPAIATPPGTVACAGSTVTYNVQNPIGGLTYTWQSTGSVAPTVQNATGTSYQVTWGAAGSGTVSLTAATAGPPVCTGGPVVRNITIDANPVPVISGPVAVCPGVDAVYETPFQAGHTYSWSLPGGTFTVTGGSVTSNTITVRWNNPGASAATRAVSVTQTSPNGCTGTANVNVTVNPAPTPIVAGNTNVCGYITNYDNLPNNANNVETYTVTNPINAGSTFQWTVQSGTITSATQGVGLTSITVQWNEPTTSASVTRVLSVSETGNGIPACTGTTNVNVQVNWQPKPSVSGPRTVCSNHQVVQNSTNAQQYPTAYTYTTPGLNQVINPPASTYVWSVTVGGTTITDNSPLTGTFGVRINGGASTLSTSSNSVGIEFFNPTTAPVTAVVRLSESISYTNGSLTPATKACAIIDTFVVTVNPLPKPAITPVPATDLCARSVVTYTTPADANSTFLWTVQSGSILGATNTNSAQVVWNDVATDDVAGFIQVAQTFTATGCSTTVRQNTTIDITPRPFITGPTALCQGTTDPLNTTNVGVYQANNETTASAGFDGFTRRTYTWAIQSQPAGGQVTIAGVASNNLGIGDRYTVTVSGNTNVPVTAVIRLTSVVNTANQPTNVGTCSKDTTFTITINPNPVPVITSTTNGLNPNGVCAGSTHTYTTPNVAGNTYNWTVTGGSINGGANTNTVSVTWGPAGNGSVSVLETVGTTGCNTRATQNVIIRALPTPAITGPAAVCALSTQTYTTPNVAGNTYNWTVTGGAINGASNTNSISVTWGSTNPGTVTVVETTPPALGSCSNTATINPVTINPLPRPLITGNNPVCVNTTHTYVDTTQSAGITYLWTVSGGTSAIVGANNQRTVSVNWSNVGIQGYTGTISVLETITATGCQATATRQITVNSRPVVTITPSGPTTLCTDGSVTLAATPGFAQYAWSTGATTPSITVTQGGSYSVTVIDINGCTSNASTPITVSITNRPKPVTQASGPTEFCEGGSVTLSVTASNVQTYRWSNGGTGNSITVTRAGFYSCEITYVDGCKQTTDAVEVKISPKPTVSVTANGPTTFCEGNNVVLDAGAGYATWKWFRGTTEVGQARTLTVTTAGSYTVTVTNAINCAATSTPLVVTVNPKPAPVITASKNPAQFCQGDSVVLDAGGNFAAYAWSNGATTKTIVVKTSGLFAVTVTDTNGCTGQSQSITVTQFPTPPRPTITRTNNVLRSSTAATYTWSRNGTVISGATSQTIDAWTSGGPGRYRVRITDQNGCVNESEESVVDTLVNVAETMLNNGLTLYPNPTNGNVFVKMNADEDYASARLIIRNLIGAEVMNLDLGSVAAGENNVRSLDVSALTNGVYYIEVVMPNGKRMTARITKVD